MRFRQECKRFLRSDLLAPTLHTLVFALTWLIYFVQQEPLMDGPSRWGFAILFFSDFPISLVAFSKLWDGRFFYALSLWGTLGAAWWYLIGVGIQSLFASKRRQPPLG
jgi:hypothetical protein